MSDHLTFVIASSLPASFLRICLHFGSVCQMAPNPKPQTSVPLLARQLPKLRFFRANSDQGVGLSMSYRALLGCRVSVVIISFIVILITFRVYGLGVRSDLDFRTGAGLCWLRLFLGKFLPTLRRWLHRT